MPYNVTSRPTRPMGLRFPPVATDRGGRRLGQVTQGPPPSIAVAQGATAASPQFVISNPGSALWVPGAVVYLWRGPAGPSNAQTLTTNVVANTVTLSAAQAQAGSVVIGDPSAGGQPQAYQYWGAIHSADKTAVSGSGASVQGAAVLGGASRFAGVGSSRLFLPALFGAAILGVALLATRR